MIISPEIKEAIDIIEKNNQSFFITGKAGTGKSTLIKEIRRKTAKRTAFLAPTGVAAVNISGQTIHSFFGFKPGITPDSVKRTYINKNLYRKLEVLVIDEISMVRADLLDSISRFLEINGPKRKPFGGVQLIMVGDLYQLPPVLTSDEAEFYNSRYQTPYFFSSKEFQKIKPNFISLKKIHRQNDPQFISVLNKIRNGQIDENELELLNKKIKPDFDCQKDGVFLTTTNRKADQINRFYLSKLTQKKEVISGITEGDFPKSYFPTESNLEIKIGARVMLLNNDKEGRWINGDVGEIIEIKKSIPMVRIALDNGRVVKVSENKWERVKFRYNKERDEIKTEEVGSFSQIPIKLSWATTIHKSQGKTFDKVMVDFESGTFSHGQAYVALSRSKSLDGLFLKRKIKKSDIIVDRRILNFLNQFER